MSKLLFYDIDGTLSMPGYPPGEDTIKAIQTARKNGHMAFISTGRPEHSVPEEIKAIGFDGGIYFAGGKIIVHGQTIFDQPMSADLTESILDILQAANISFNMECIEHNYRQAAIPDFSRHGDRRNDIDNVGGDIISLDFMRSANTEFQRVLQMEKNDPRGRSFEQYVDEPVYKISFRVSSRTQFEDLSDTIYKRFGDEAKVVSFENMAPDFPLIFCEVSRQIVNKGNALKLICEHFKADLSQSVAFGDSMNDAEIIVAAGIGVAMDNSEDRLKSLADRVCESCAENGVAKEMARMGLI